MQLTNQEGQELPLVGLQMLQTYHPTVTVLVLAIVLAIVLVLVLVLVLAIVTDFYAFFCCDYRDAYGA